jgi:hypothetical protein
MYTHCAGKLCFWVLTAAVNHYARDTIRLNPSKAGTHLHASRTWLAPRVLARGCVHADLDAFLAVGRRDIRRHVIIHARDVAERPLNTVGTAVPTRVALICRDRAVDRYGVKGGLA